MTGIMTESLSVFVASGAGAQCTSISTKSKVQTNRNNSQWTEGGGVNEGDGKEEEKD
jgi:hypothetical protein